MTLSLIAITSVISVLAFSQESSLFEQLALDKFAVADGEYWRLFTVTLLHGGFLHLIFNMYALYLAGSLVEQLYGPRLYLAIYLLSAAAGSSAATCSVATSRRSARRARCSGCSACCSRSRGRTIRCSTGAARCCSGRSAA